MIKVLGTEFNRYNNYTRKYKTNSLDKSIDNKPNYQKTTMQSAIGHNVGYINFKAKKNGAVTNELKNKMSQIEGNATYHGQILINKAKDFVRSNSLKTITQPIILLLGLQSLIEYINLLNSGELASDDDSSFGIPNVFFSEFGDCMDDTEKRNKLKAVIEDELPNIANYIKNNSTDNILDKKYKNNYEPTFSKDFLNDIYSVHKQINNSDEESDGLFDDALIFEAAMYTGNDKIIKDLTNPFKLKLYKKIMIDDHSDSKTPHLSFYDEKAKKIWDNLAVGTNMTILNDKDTTPNYLIESFYHVFENTPDGFGSLNKNNTEIIKFNQDYFDIKFLNKMIQSANKNPNTNYVILLNIMGKNLTTMEDTLFINSGSANIFKNAPKNIKFVMLANKDVYYNEYNDEIRGDFFDYYGVATIPIMNVYDAQQMFKEQPELLDKIKKKFTREALERSIEVSNGLKGNYPEKAQKILGLISSYYIDNDKIKVEDVNNYVRIAPDIFRNADDNNASFKLLFDTKLNLDDLVGSPTTKKEAKNIVESIKDKSFGTKGFIIYSQDGSVGAGRRHTAKAIAGETKSPYFEINAVDFGTKDVDLFGNGNLSPEASMKKMFEKIKTQAEINDYKSAVLLIENFEFFLFGQMLSEYHQKAMAQLVREIKKADDEGFNIAVFGSMNNPQYIDDSTERSLAFQDKIELESPGYNSIARKEIIDYYIKKQGLHLEGDKSKQNLIIEHVNNLLENSSYSEIMALLKKVKTVAKERKHSQITKGDFTEAYLQLLTGRPSSIKEPDYRKKLVTSHECGHALNALVMEMLAQKENKPSHTGTKVNFITLDPRGSFGGAVFTIDNDNPEISFEHIFSNIVCDFGGTSSEKMHYAQDGSWGITTDMQMATSLATRAAGIMGQGYNFGKKSLNGMLFISEEDKEKLNKDIDVILKNAQVVSEAITSVYADFNKEFTEKYYTKVGTGDCIIHRKEFIEMLNDWKSRQSDEKLKELEELDNAILMVIDRTKKGVICRREE